MTSSNAETHNSGAKGLVFNIQRYSIHDGPGIRTTVFLKGCPLKCKWCSNPESINPSPELMVRESQCDGCGKCVEPCTHHAIELHDDHVHIDRSKCDLCLKCAEACPRGAIELSGKYMSVEEALEECSKDEIFYQNSGGGVTLSGGEPLYQPEFTLNLLQACKEKALNTAIDTSGFANWKIIEKMLPYIDLVLYDIKHLDPEMHASATGVSNEVILDNLQKIVKSGKTRVWIRIPVIPNFNDSETYIEKLAKTLVGMPAEKISLLGYHEWGKSKYFSLGKEYPLNGCAPLAEERLESLKDIMQSRGLQVTIGY
ncbi:MAG: glycyl-radical enzyme activating protein [Chloroflexi bacterium]|nr:glycyl-radical enzyme activating protein [Chloroflexota bacterium]MBM3183102.1 glycyl-radical enzyme activating protein [Chloroflexota bacterium]MBM4452300.1 glycyl-radical enzyme activating protein [Chloroflexota bacterium]MBM4453654.1 glycyl-radical enzyme activating protein [Chloroflexota bacterium]